LTGCCNGPGYLEVSEFIQWYQLASHWSGGGSTYVQLLQMGN
jgi:hypothetical protein